MLVDLKPTIDFNPVKFPRVNSPDIRAQIHQLSEVDNIRGFFRLGGDYAVWGLTVLATIPCPWLYPLALVIIGSRMRAIENLMHEGSHRCLFQNRALNDTVAELFTAFPLHISLEDYREGHIIHHRYLGLPIDVDFDKYGDLPLPAGQKLRRLLAIFTGTHALKENAAYFSSPYRKPRSRRELAARLVFWTVCFALITLTHSWWGFFWFYVVPFVTSFRTIRQLVDLSEHHLNPSIEYHTRNVLINPILCFIIYPHADNIHYLHHTCPSVPGYALPELHELLLANSPEYAQTPAFESYFFGSDSVLATAFKD